MELKDILGGFTKVKTQLTDFITDQTETNDKLREELHTGEAEVKEAKAALKQVIKFVGK